MTDIIMIYFVHKDLSRSDSLWEWRYESLMLSICFCYQENFIFTKLKSQVCSFL